MELIVNEDLINKTKEILIPKGCKIKRVTKDKIILVEKKKELPKTWEECYKLLNKGEYIDRNSTIESGLFPLNLEPTCDERNTLPVGFAKPMLALMQLLVCREVYRDGWKPDWKNRTNNPCICYIHDQITPSYTTCTNSILSFQSREIRDKFLENFKNLIEEAKELI